MLRDISVYLEKMSDFSRLLRDRGISCGLKETADACTLLADEALADRETVKCILRAVYAKTQAEQEIFDRCFDRFFITAEAKHAIEEAEQKAAAAYEQKRREAEQELTYNGRPMELSEEYRDIYIRMPEEAKEKLKRVRERFQDNMDRSPELYASFIHSVFMRSILEQQMLLEDAAAHAEHFDSPELELLYRDISRFQEREIPQAIALIEKISRQLNGELQARQQRAGSSGKLDFKGTIRRGLQTGGALFRLKYRRKRHRKRHIVMLCDVSASMLQFSEFALHFIQSLAETSSYSRTFIFSEGLQEISSFSMQSGDSFRSYVKSTGLFGKGTDLSRALRELLALRPPVLGASTILLILSDAKTVNAAETGLLLGEAGRQAGNVLWLNPIPESKWEYIPTVFRMSQICKMIPCSTLSELARACRKLVR